MNRSINIFLILGFVAILCIGFWLRIELIGNMMPYVTFYDEPHVSVPAYNILKSGDFQPESYYYPSFPKYLAAVGFTLGYISQAKHMIHQEEMWGQIEYPYYTHPGIAMGGRALFALFSVLAIALASLQAWKITRSPMVLLLAPLLVLLAREYLFSSYFYINVDIAAAFFAALTLFSIDNYRLEKRIFFRAILPGILAGLTIACKYSLAPILLVPLLFILLKEPRRFVPYSVVVLLSSVFAFFLVNPFALLDFNTFITNVGMEIRHYASGHAGATVLPGLSHMGVILGSLFENFGWFCLFAAPVGMVWMLKKSWRSLLILIFVFSYFLFISGQKVFFPRNSLVIYLYFGVIAAAGIVALSRWLKTMLVTRGPKSLIKHSRWIAPTAIGLLLIISIPWAGVLKAHELKRDSRSVAIDYLMVSVKEGETIVVPSELYLDIRPLQERFKVELIPFKWWQEDVREDVFKKFKGAVFLQPVYAMDERRPKRHFMANDLNRQIEKYVIPIKKFGSKPVLENYDYPVPQGDPEFYVTQIAY